MKNVQLISVIGIIQYFVNLSHACSVIASIIRCITSLINNKVCVGNDDYKHDTAEK